MYLGVNFDNIFVCILQNGNAAASLSVAEQYVSAFSNLAKQSNTILLPSNTGDISGMVTQVCVHALMHPIIFTALTVLSASHYDTNGFQLVSLPLRL